ncbi:MAG: cysteine desulfurase-like protein [Microbacteriaceae bacterium]|nr:cysteine desulfurase-like protein [Microbacteriaceae bacterium]
MTSHPRSFDIEALRLEFPALVGGTAFFDSPGGTQYPNAVGDAIRAALLAPLANRGTVSQAERNAAQIVQQSRTALGDFLNVESDTVIFGRSTTALTFDMSRAISKSWLPGDEIVLTTLEHNSNVSPWVIAAERAGAVIRWVDFDPATGELEVEAVREQLSDRTRLVAITAASNVIGTEPDVAQIADAVHLVGALLWVDGVHYAAHALVDVPAMGADFFTCSPYKFLGPHCAAVTGRRELLEGLLPDRLSVSPSVVPERFELGTLPYELMAGTTAAIDFLANIAPFGTEGRRQRLKSSIAAVDAHETQLRVTIEAGLAEFEQLTIHSRAKRRTPTLFVSLATHREKELSRFLGDRNINTPASHFYAVDASHRLGLGSEGALRIGLAPYNNRNDVDRLLNAVSDFFA